MQSLVSPKYRLISKGFSLQKTQKQYMKTLEQEVEKSKVAVENITTFAFTEQQLRKKIDDIQNELRSCITKIHTEIKKQKVLNELICLLKGEMFKYQTTQKKEEELDNTNHEKLVKKINYDIDQILQKHNEEIARISLLKEEASSRRSERVVYSNLFKKLEKEIKYYEEIYKDQLMKSETATRKNSSGQIKTHQISNMIKLNPQQREKKKQILPGKSQIRQSLLGTQIPSEELFITNGREEDGEANEKKIKHISSFNDSKEKMFYDWKVKSEEQPKIVIEQNKQYSKDENHYLNFLEKIKVYTECSSAKEILEHFSTLESQSKELAEDIEDLNEGIQNCRSEEQKLAKKLHQEEFAYRYTIRLNEIALTKEIVEKEERNKAKQKNIEEMVECIQVVSKLFGIGEREDEKKVPSEECLRVMDLKVEMLCSADKNLISVNRSKDETIMSENVVDNLLEKMDKFNDCERILDKNLFKQEYYKELSKGKKGWYKMKK